MIGAGPGRPGSGGSLELLGGASAFSEDVFCLFDPVPGRPGSRPAVTRKVRTTTQVVTGQRSVPVIVTG